MKWILALPGGLLWALVLSPTPSPCQELGVSYVVAATNHPELPDPTGFTAFALMPLTPDWFFRVSFHRITDGTVKDGRVCSSYVPHIACRIEETRTSISLSGLRLGISRALLKGENLRIRAGGGFSFNVLNGDAVGVSGLKADFMAPKEGQVGAFGALSLAVTPYPRVPIAVVGGAQVNWVKFHTCSAGDPPQYDPFCTPSAFREFDVGLSFPFR